MTSYAKTAPYLFLFICTFTFSVLVFGSLTFFFAPVIANCDVVEIKKDSYAREVKEALSEVHKLLDDDHSGSIDSLESKEARVAI